jgi:hypothetical protein
MSSRLNSRLHHQLGVIHDTLEGAFLSAGMMLSTLIVLFVVYVTLMLMGR